MTNPHQCESDHSRSLSHHTTRGLVPSPGAHCCPGCSLTARYCQGTSAVPSRDQPALVNSSAPQDPNSPSSAGSHSSTFIPDNQPARQAPIAPPCLSSCVPFMSTLTSWLPDELRSAFVTDSSITLPRKTAGPHRRGLPASLPSQSPPPAGGFGCLSEL